MIPHFPFYFLRIGNFIYPFHQSKHKSRYSNRMILIFRSSCFTFTYSAQYFCCWNPTPEQRNCLSQEVRIALAITIKCICRKRRWHYATKECSIFQKTSRDIGWTSFVSQLTKKLGNSEKYRWRIDSQRPPFYFDTL